ncbi:MAG: peptidase U32 family protein [Acidiferrobacterales bacterium]
MAEAHGTVELICPAGGLPSLKAAVDNGADAVYLGFRDATNARNFPGLNFDDSEVQTAIRYAHERGKRVFLAVNTYPRPTRWEVSRRAVDRAARLGVDALLVADAGLMRYAARTYPDLRLHLSVQSSATNHEAIGFYARHFGIKRVVLPRVLSVSQVRNIIDRVNVEVEVFGFGSLCVMVEGRCALSSFVTGDSPNMSGVCSPAKAVRWEEDAAGRKSRLNGVLIDVYAPDKAAGYPTLCKGRFEVGGEVFYALEEPTSLNVLGILSQLVKAGVAAIKVEGRQRSPAYVAGVTRVLRAALDACHRDPEHFVPTHEWIAQLDKVAEGRCHTLGAYHRPWQ